MKKYFTLEEAADYLCLSPNTMRKWVAERKNLAYIKVGRRIIFDGQELENFIEKQTISPLN